MNEFDYEPERELVDCGLAYTAEFDAIADQYHRLMIAMWLWMTGTGLVLAVLTGVLLAVYNRGC